MFAGTQVSNDQILAKQSIKEALKEAELQKQVKVMQQQIDVEDKQVLPSSMQKSIKEQLEKKKNQRRLSMWAGAQVSQDLIDARQGIKEALKEAELQKTIKVMEAQIKVEEKKNKEEELERTLKAMQAQIELEE